MARKNPFANILDSDERPVERSVVEYAARGASRSILSTLDEMASRADKLASGETIVELEPDVVDVSFVRDRRADNEQEFSELLEAIRENGQNSPILVRPHPKATGRYMVVFGHRRVQVAKALGRKVRAVIKQMEDREHVLTLGQENSARANVPFVERALFAADLARLRYDEDNATILKALSIDRTTLSKMLSVAALPADILAAIGEAKGIGRDRWYELKLLMDKPSNHDIASEVVNEDGFSALPSDARFDLLVRRLKTASSRKRTQSGPQKRSWAPKGGSLSADITTDAKRFTLAIKAKSSEARAFGDYLSENLDRLYEAFRRDSTQPREEP
ncbi:plasmid partitioning protein RepB [Mesorhizobium sp. M2D.F.Ca.ET.185.01.1.1]|uniref:plasmid partitioning protein RepB n=1 Tax=unclassified Mesorhizobium TaxID=325217 RepID=UPI000FCAE06C|nr:MULTISPECIES: plasmid partitioning protein RepB [unclassified Mesorhizobium]TGP77260.1 plasmid partitioning protein RepB [bacterium M00.F.Ca.ET.227.01.1.1]TGP93053.1 plasmid partitioning protein RepB [bacterium M00.F.Ca.ET.222.01.1.1]TGP96599.1 plasmid partitioning protein RepB [bacterium M00.F.Ca.ET.221.01.1.1]TGU20770.1 plasmid partitioning protein RepB [bacterium M00.F.Ca.ET.156.01.1.1]TGU49811.1 plasmid partitioning protein RepB [bacterium M00.F.Ca.ET.146.01.1.1]TGV68676.1 plasmid part